MSDVRHAVLALFLAGCQGCQHEPAIDPAELERLRAEQREMRAKIEALQARIDRQTMPAPVPAPNPAPTPLPRPLLTNIGTRENGAVMTTKPSASAIPLVSPSPSVFASPSPSAGPSTSSLKTEDLHGMSVGVSPSGAPDREGAALLQQMQTQMQALQRNQAAEQSALDQIEKER